MPFLLPWLFTHSYPNHFSLHQHMHRNQTLRRTIRAPGCFATEAAYRYKMLRPWKEFLGWKVVKNYRNLSMIPQQKAGYFLGFQTVAATEGRSLENSHDEKLFSFLVTLKKKKKNRNVLHFDSRPCFGMWTSSTKRWNPQKMSSNPYPLRSGEKNPQITCRLESLPETFVGWNPDLRLENFPKENAKPLGGPTVWPFHSALSTGQQKTEVSS